MIVIEKSSKKSKTNLDSFEIKTFNEKERYYFKGFEKFNIYSIMDEIIIKTSRVIKKATSLVNFIAYKILHFNKAFDWISISQMEEALGFSRNTVKKHLLIAINTEVLLAYNTQVNNQERTYYFLNTPTFKTIVYGLKSGIIAFSDLLSIEKSFNSERVYLNNKTKELEASDITKTFKVWKEKRDKAYESLALKIKSIIDLTYQNLTGEGSKIDSNGINFSSSDGQKNDLHLDITTVDREKNDICIRESSTRNEIESNNLESKTFDVDSLIQIKTNEEIEKQKVKAEVITSIADTTTPLIEKMKEGVDSITKKIGSALGFGLPSAPVSQKNKPFSDEQERVIELILSGTYIDPENNIKSNSNDIKKTTAEKWVKQYPLEKIELAVQNLKFRRGTKNAGAFLTEELKVNGYDSPKEVIEIEKNKKREELESKLDIIYYSFYDKNNSDSGKWSIVPLKTKLNEVIITDENIDMIQDILTKLLETIEKELLLEVLPNKLQIELSKIIARKALGRK